MLRAHAQDNPIFSARDFLQRYRHLAVTLRGIVFAQRITFPFVRQDNAAEVGMTFEGDSKQVEDFTLNTHMPEGQTGTTLRQRGRSPSTRTFRRRRWAVSSESRW